MYCGPWIGNGDLATHTEEAYGSIGQTFYAEVLLSYEGINNMIAHLKIGEIQAAIGQSIEVVPRKGK